MKKKLLAWIVLAMMMLGSVIPASTVMADTNTSAANVISYVLQYVPTIGEKWTGTTAKDTTLYNQRQSGYEFTIDSSNQTFLVGLTVTNMETTYSGYYPVSKGNIVFEITKVDEKNKTYQGKINWTSTNDMEVPTFGTFCGTFKTSTGTGESGGNGSGGGTNPSQGSGSQNPASGTQQTITKRANVIIQITKGKSFKAKKLKKKPAAFQIKAVAKGNAKLKFTKLYIPKKAKKYIKVSSSGKVAIRNGLKKGTYKIKVKITAGATKTYKAASKTVVVKIVVK